MDPAIVRAILDNASSLSGIAVAMVGTIAFVFALATGRLYLPSTVRAEQETCRLQREALQAADDELKRVEKLLTRLQLEKEVGWRARPTVQRKAKPR